MFYCVVKHCLMPLNGTRCSYIAHADMRWSVVFIRKVLTFVFRALWYLDDYQRVINYGKWYKAGRVHKTAGMWNIHSTEQLLTPELNVHSSPLNNGHIVIFFASQFSDQTALYGPFWSFSQMDTFFCGCMGYYDPCTIMFTEFYDFFCKCEARLCVL